MFPTYDGPHRFLDQDDINGICALYVQFAPGDLRWYDHEGWQGFRSVFATSDGVIYGIQPNGDLLWYKHEGWEEGSRRRASGSGTRVGNGRQGFRSVVATSDGILYGIQP